MNKTADAQIDETATTWSKSAPHVRKALAFIAARGKRGMVTNADDLVEWDWTHGRRLFNWDDPAAAAEWRKQQARVFLNSFRGMFEKMRVRAFIHVREDADAEIAESGYVTTEHISQHPGMRAQVIDDITRRMRTLASELQMWKLTEDERAKIIAQLAEAMGGKALKRKAA